MVEERLKILVISLQGMGNVLLSLPAIKQYSEINPSDITMVVANHGLHKILARLGFIKDIYLWDGNISSCPNIISLRKSIKGYFYDKAFASDPSIKRENLLLFLCNAKAKRSFHYYNYMASWKMLCFLNPKRNVRNNCWHDAEANMRLFGFDGIPVKGIDLKPLILEEEKLYARELLNGHPSPVLMTLHPGSLGLNRRWAAEKYIELCNRIVNKYDCRFVLIGGKEELDLRMEIGSKVKNNPIVLKNETLSQTIAIMNETHFFLGNDSGPMHMAAALGLPMLILWGYADFRLTTPLSDDCLVVRKNIPCSPCYDFLKAIPSKCKFNFRCINDILVDEVYPILRQYIDCKIGRGKDVLETIANLDVVDSITQLKNGPSLINLKPHEV